MSTRKIVTFLVLLSPFFLLAGISAADPLQGPDDVPVATPGDSPDAEPVPDQPSDTSMDEPMDEEPAPDSASTPSSAEDIEEPAAPVSIEVYFQHNAVTLNDEAKRYLDEVANWMAADSKRVLVLRLPSDMPMAAERHMAIERYMAERGIDSSRLMVISMSEGPGDMQPQDIRVVALNEEPPGPIVNNYNVSVQPPTAPEPEQGPSHLVTPNGMSITIGGGVMDFTDGTTRDLTGVAGTWETRLAYGTRALIAGEVAYIGSARNVDALGLDSDALILGSSFEGAVRLNLVPFANVQPYAVGGFGVTRWNVVNEDFNTSSVRDSDTALHVPLGLGLGFRASGFLLDLRGTYRLMFQDELTSTDRTEDKASADVWQAGANVGWEF